MSRRLHISEIEEAAKLIRWISALRKIEKAIEQGDLDGAKLLASPKGKKDEPQRMVTFHDWFIAMERSGQGNNSLSAWLQAPFVLDAIGNQIRALEAAVISLGVEI